MTDAQKIEEGAIIDAKGDFEALNQYLEELKQKIHNYKLKNPGRIYSGIALFSFGYFLGLRTDRRINWILQLVSGYTFGYTAVQSLGLFLREKNPEKPETAVKKEEPQKKLKNIKIVSEEQ